MKHMQEYNHLYNLMTQLTQEMRSLWRIEKHYIADSDSDAEHEMWEKMKADKVTHIKELKNLLQEALEEKED